jgi:hypothetical protein
MFYFPYDEEDYQRGQQMTESELGKKKIGKWTDGAVRRFIRNVGGQDAVNDLFKLRIADATANPKGMFDPRELELLEMRIADVLVKDTALKISDLDINGKDLQAIGIEPGPKMGQILKDLLEMVLEDPALNDKARLLAVVKKKYL